MAFVYKIELKGKNLSSKYLPIYYGVTKSYYMWRIQSHVEQVCRSGRLTRNRLYKVWNRPLKNIGFSVDIVYEGTLQDCLNKEKEFISKENENAKDLGLEGCLNESDGGEHPDVTPEKFYSEDKETHEENYQEKNIVGLGTL